MLYKFYRIKGNSTKASSKDREAKLQINYSEDINETHIILQIKEKKHKIHFESHHNGSCTVFLPKDSHLSHDDLENVERALKVLKFDQNIEFDFG